MYETAQQCWSRLDGIKQPLMRRVERYAALTLPKICLPNGFNNETTDQTHDFQSVGAQCVNHVTNKLMLALFAPSRPFFKLQPEGAELNKLQAGGFSENDINTVLATVEKKAVTQLDALAQRPKLYTGVRHIVVTGNVLMCLGKDVIRMMGLRYWCVKRTAAGEVHTLIIRECVKFDELDPKIRAACGRRYQDDSEVEHFRYIRLLPNGDYGMNQWVNEQRLPTEFDGKWPAEKMPYRILTWDLGDDADYATGLVEEYAGDFEALSALSESVVDGAILGAELRWMVNPSGQTSADDMNKSKNGDFLPGLVADVGVTQSDNSKAISVAQSVGHDYEQRISRGFLLNSAVTRDAERVTAEEIRQTAMELETSFGGVYSTLAAGIQAPIASWLLVSIKAQIKGTAFKIVVITGLDALSRNGDLEALRLALQDMAGLATLPEPLLIRLKYDEIMGFVGQGRGVDLKKFIMSEKEFSAAQQAAQASRVNEAGATAGAEAAGTQAGEQPVE